MEGKDKVTLTREWIMLMLLGTTKSLDELIAHGCKVMVFGHEYEEFLEIVNTLCAEGYVFESSNKSYVLNQKGIFYVKKHIIIPLERLIEDQGRLDFFIGKYKDECDTEFLKKYNGEMTEDKRTAQLKYFAEQNYHKVAIIILLILTYLK